MEVHSLTCSMPRMVLGSEDKRVNKKTPDFMALIDKWVGTGIKMNQGVKQPQGIVSPVCLKCGVADEEKLDMSLKRSTLGRSGRV